MMIVHVTSLYYDIIVFLCCDYIMNYIRVSSAIPIAVQSMCILISANLKTYQLQRGTLY